MFGETGESSDERSVAPPYETPAINEAIRIFDMTSWQRTVPAVYLGYEHVSDEFFMHRVRSDKGLESMLASYEVFRRHESAGGVEWVALTKRLGLAAVGRSPNNRVNLTRLAWFTMAGNRRASYAPHVRRDDGGLMSRRLILAVASLMAALYLILRPWAAVLDRLHVLGIAYAAAVLIPVGAAILTTAFVVAGWSGSHGRGRVWRSLIAAVAAIALALAASMIVLVLPRSALPIAYSEPVSILLMLLWSLETVVAAGMVARVTP